MGFLGLFWDKKWVWDISKTQRCGWYFIWQFQLITQYKYKHSKNELEHHSLYATLFSNNRNLFLFTTNIFNNLNTNLNDLDPLIMHGLSCLVLFFLILTSMTLTLLSWIFWSSSYLFNTNLDDLDPLIMVFLVEFYSSW